MAFPVVGFQSMLHTAAVIASSPSAAPGFDVNDLQDHRHYTILKSSSQDSPLEIDIDMGATATASADYYAFVNHNLVGQVSQVRTRVFADTSFPPTTNRAGNVVVDTEGVHYVSFTEAGHRKNVGVSIIADAQPSWHQEIAVVTIKYKDKRQPLERMVIQEGV